MAEFTPISALTLRRYPAQSDHSPLQAWDAADEYLLEHIESLSAIDGDVWLFNDAFGALSCALQRYQPVHISDSYISQQAAKLNLKRNTFAAESVTFLDSLAELEGCPALVLIKIPKTLALLEWQLSQLSQHITENTVVIASAKVTEIHTSTLQLFEKWLGTTKTSLAKKKARLIFAQNDRQTKPTLEPLIRWPLDETNYEIANYASVFSRNSLDIGARFFLANLPDNLMGTVADLGCGNGVLGLRALEKNPDIGVLFCDESFMAVASAQYNVEHNRSQDRERCEFRVDNCLSQQPENSLNVILCNPPFHQNNVITDHIAKQMFNDAKRCLTRGGELYIVGNRHLSYYQYLKTLFTNCETIASNHKFVILKSVKLK